MPKLEEFITLEQAATKYNLDKALLTELAEAGRIKAGKLDGTIVLAEEEVKRVAQKLSEHASKYGTLDGKPIRVTEAAEKYCIPHGTLSRWAKAGYIRVIERGPKRLVLNEADVAKAKDLIKKRGMRKGRGVFREPVYLS